MTNKNIQLELQELLDNPVNSVTQKFSQAVKPQSQHPASQLLDTHYKAYGGTDSQVVPNQSVAHPSQSQYLTQQPMAEPLLEDNLNRFVILPIQYKYIWRMYKDQMACFWTVDEIDLSQDTKDW